MKRATSPTGACSDMLLDARVSSSPGELHSSPSRQISFGRATSLEADVPTENGEVSPEPEETEEPTGAHVSEDDPLLAIGLVVAAGMNVLNPPDLRSGAHVSEDDPLLSIEHRAAHATKGPGSDPVPRGAHVSEDDPLLAIEHRAAHATNALAAPDPPRGAHVSGADPLLAVERRAVHAMKSRAQGHLQSQPPRGPAQDVAESRTPQITIDVRTHGDMSALASGDAPQSGTAPDGAVTAEAEAPTGAGRDPSFGIAVRKSLQRDVDAREPVDLATKRQSARTRARRRRRLVPIAGAAGAVVAGLGGGTAVAFIASYGSGSGQTVSGGPVAVTIAATTGAADLLPGQAGAVSFTLHNPASSPGTFDQIAPGATVVSDNTGLCASDYVSLATTLPYTLPTPITVSPGATSGVQTVADLVTLAPNAPSACQGVTFTVRFTLSGRSS